MLYRDRFSGHLDIEDPRTVISGAGGCTWPTIPPFRLQLSSTNGTGEWFWMRSTPVILQQDILASHHDYILWTAIEQPAVVYRCLVEKFFNKNIWPNWDIYITIRLALWPTERVWQQRFTGKCNKDYRFGERWRRKRDGTTGDQLCCWQVEHDKMRSPWWNP